MPTERFKSKEAYRKFNAYRHIHGIPAPHLKEVAIGQGKNAKQHKVKHAKPSKEKRA